MVLSWVQYRPLEMNGAFHAGAVTIAISLAATQGSGFNMSDRLGEIN